MTHQDPLSLRLTRLLNARPGRGVSLDALCELAPDVSRDQVRNALKYLVKIGQAARLGTLRNPLYQSLIPNGAVSTDAKINTTSSVAGPPRANAKVVWPENVRVQYGPSPSGLTGQWEGVNWASATVRDGCNDFLDIYSRRGDLRVPHGSSMGMRAIRKST